MKTKILATLWLCAMAHAATETSNIAVNSTLTAGSTGSYTATGTATFTGQFAGSGTFNATLNLTTGTAPFTITFSGGTMGGTLTIPLAVFSAILSGATSASGASATITSATGSYAGDTGNFPSLSGSGGVGSTGAITLSFTGAGTITTGGTVTAPPPSVTAVADAASNNLSNAVLAQGTIFIVQGTGLTNVTSLAAFSVPRPTTSPNDGVQIIFTPVSGGTGTDALIWYEDPQIPGGKQQLAGIVPSTLATGQYNLTVNVKGTVSTGFPVQIVASKFALFTQDSTGGGLASAQNVVSATEYDLNRLTTGVISGYGPYSPAYPGQYMVIYGTGMGGVSGSDNAASPDYNFAVNGVNVQVIIGGVTIPVLYAGLAGYPGEDQINFQLPTTIPTGCVVTLQVSVNGALSPATYIAIAPSASAGACVLSGFTTSQLQALDNGGTITSGAFAISQFSETIPGEGSGTFGSIGGNFSQVTGFELQSAPQITSSQTQIGSCTVITTTLQGGQTVVAGGSATYLDAGNLTITGPSGSSLTNTPLIDTLNVYSLSLGSFGGVSIPGAVNATLVGGTYTLAGSGGADVGKFSTSITLGTPLTVTGGLPSAVNRSQSLPISWTGGNSTDNVTITGYSGTSTGSGASAVSTVTEFICRTTAGTGGFTVPSSVLSQLQATPASSAGGTGFLEVSSGPTPVSFSPTLTAGGTVASILSAGFGTAASVVYQ